MPLVDDGVSDPEKNGVDRFSSLGQHAAENLKRAIARGHGPVDHAAHDHTSILHRRHHGAEELIGLRLCVRKDIADAAPEQLQTLHHRTPGECRDVRGLRHDPVDDVSNRTKVRENGVQDSAEI